MFSEHHDRCSRSAAAAGRRRPPPPPPLHLLPPASSTSPTATINGDGPAAATTPWRCHPRFDRGSLQQQCDERAALLLGECCPGHARTSLRTHLLTDHNAAFRICARCGSQSASPELRQRCIRLLGGALARMGVHLSSREGKPGRSTDRRPLRHPTTAAAPTT